MSRKSVAAKSAIVAGGVIVCLAVGIGLVWAEGFSPSSLDITLLWSPLNEWYNGYGEIYATGLQNGQHYLVRPVQFEYVHDIGLNGVWGFNPPAGGYHNWTAGSSSHYILVDLISFDPPCACFIQLWKDNSNPGYVDAGDEKVATIWVSGDTN